MGSTLMTPLYALYRREFGFSEITLTLVYSIYVVGNVTALLLFGRVSDRIGRKRIGLPALALAGVSAVLFLFAANTAWLFVARTLSGFAVGIASGTGTAWLAELYGSEKRSLATLAAACANFAGVAVGPLLAGPLAQYAPWPLALSFIVYLVLAAIAAFLLSRAPETVEQECTIRQALTVRPRIGVPRELWGSFIAPAINVFGTFALVGFYAALIPSILMQDLHQKNLAVGGAVVFELFAVSTVTILVTRAIKSERAMFSGLALLLPGLGLLVLAQETQIDAAASFGDRHRRDCSRPGLPRKLASHQRHRTRR